MDEQAARSVVEGLVNAAGDDAAVVDGTVLTIDMLHERTDFPPGTSRYTTGWRSVGVSLSDVAAMGATATATVAAFGVPEFDADVLETFLEGARDVSTAVGAQYVGGDLDQHSEFTVATAAIGTTEQPVRRSGASPGELLCVTGTLGRGAAGVRAFEAGAIGLGNDLFQFTPRVEAGQALAGVATAMMDSSDGLARSLHQLGAASDVGFQVDGNAIPVADTLDRFLAVGETGSEVAGTYGGDFELVFTIPKAELEAVRSALSVPVTVIGEVRPAAAGIELDGEPLPDQGYTHGESTDR
ncbi:thiamine-monophosphate kinase [Halodesulfurarchaeum formicicum]|uniref:Thiamine-monophosphate kinase n=1 Tax=Halodesulfurarchaeum formicicum TaxID=1873524 RepID=A0A1D8S1Y0_9EURY|nr:thiamine-phosphate kinase [Halodesulfurarchaeum formicicum]AOW79365.1 thiamine-monophosphate kinase [Halodesulfurarchaeum formicicum]APE94627.1 thiamine-monophosphate kinase [Halodesulfurarchaeum formicicum]